MGAPLKSEPQEVTAEHLEELGRLADTAGVEVVSTLVQRIDHPSHATYIGEGKAEELKMMAEVEGATLIIFDDELSPTQGRNLEEAIGVRVMDRAELILDIFATRARSSEAKAQVELAQLRYTRPRLKRMWTHLSRVRGGVGMRGPGETQLETDRRMIDHRIARLAEELERVARQRATQRKGRAEQLKVSLVGYTNAGKSSILRGLSGADVFIEDRLFATLDPTTRAVDAGEGNEVLMTDTVGFIRKLPHHLVASFRATLEEAREADLLLHVIDASHPGWEEQKFVVEEVLSDLKLRDRPTVLADRAVDSSGTRAVFASTVEPGGLDALRALLLDEVRRLRPDVRLVLSSSQGGLLAEIYRDGEVLEREDEGEEVRVRARLSDGSIARLRSRGVKV
jgi:GTP-binding protein HflX